jgi:uncharacterized protein YegP (UPF0339 family)
MWRFEVFKDEDRGWRWRLIQAKALIVTESSEIYGRRGDAKRAAEKARAELSVAPIEGA